MKRKVLVSRGYGAGWATWNSECGKALAEDPELIAMVESGAHEGECAYTGEMLPGCDTPQHRDFMRHKCSQAFFDRKVFASPRTRWLDEQQCAAVHDACDELAETRRYGSGVDALRACMFLPIRSGAIFRLQWHQIGGDFESVTVVDKGKPRTWAVGSVVRELLARRRRDARAASWVFWGRPTTQHIHPTTVRTIFLKALTIAKIDPRGVSVHTLRHSLATNLLRDGEAVETAQRALGHSSPKITEQYYLHHVPTRARVAVESLNLKVISLKARKAGAL